MNEKGQNKVVNPWRGAAIELEQLQNDIGKTGNRRSPYGEAAIKLEQLQNDIGKIDKGISDVNNKLKAPGITDQVKNFLKAHHRAYFTQRSNKLSDTSEVFNLHNPPGPNGGRKNRLKTKRNNKRITPFNISNADFIIKIYL
jgi:hypothetical protein